MKKATFLIYLIFLKNETSKTIWIPQEHAVSIQLTYVCTKERGWAWPAHPHLFIILTLVDSVSFLGDPESLCSADDLFLPNTRRSQQYNVHFLAHTVTTSGQECNPTGGPSSWEWSMVLVKLSEHKAHGPIPFHGYFKAYLSGQKTRIW